jgi:hypothetical protein
VDASDNLLEDRTVEPLFSLPELHTLKLAGNRCMFSPTWCFVGNSLQPVPYVPTIIHGCAQALTCTRGIGWSEVPTRARPLSGVYFSLHRGHGIVLQRRSATLYILHYSYPRVHRSQNIISDIFLPGGASLECLEHVNLAHNRLTGACPLSQLLPSYTSQGCELCPSTPSLPHATSGIRGGHCWMC